MSNISPLCKTGTQIKFVHMHPIFTKSQASYANPRAPPATTPTTLESKPARASVGSTAAGRAHMDPNSSAAVWRSSMHAIPTLDLRAMPGVPEASKPSFVSPGHSTWKSATMSSNCPNLITCFANDYGHENWVTEAIKAYLNKNDIVILISSSGNSKNIVNAATHCKNYNIPLITLSGFSEDNSLSKLGNVNIHIKSENFNFIEMSHHIILLSIVDIFANKII